MFHIISPDKVYKSLYSNIYLYTGDEQTMKKENNLKYYLRKNFYLDTTVSINDNREVIVENCKKILEYNDIFIKISTPTVTFQIWGNNLRIKNYEDKGLIIEGVISSIEFL